MCSYYLQDKIHWKPSYRKLFKIISIQQKIVNWYVAGLSDSTGFFIFMSKERYVLNNKTIQNIRLYFL